MKDQNFNYISWRQATSDDGAKSDEIAILTLDRPDKFNAINDELLLELETFFEQLDARYKAVIMASSSKHFSAGLDLSEHSERNAAEAMHQCRLWHRVFEKIEYGPRPVIAVMNGGVIGGGLELAMSTHVRIAETHSFYELPEGRRGIFVGGGATVRVGRTIGSSRMMEMMLTGRRYQAEDGLRLGLSHYVEEKGSGFAKAIELADTIVENAELSNFMMMQAITRICDMSASDGLFTESLAAAMAQSSPEAIAGMQAFVNKNRK